MKYLLLIVWSCLGIPIMPMTDTYNRFRQTERERERARDIFFFIRNDSMKKLLR